jgi:hypothetical protein
MRGGGAPARVQNPTERHRKPLALKAIAAVTQVICEQISAQICM